MQSRSAEDTHKLLLEFLKNGREGLPADLCHALPATLLKAAETFISNGDLIWAMSVFECVARVASSPSRVDTPSHRLSAARFAVRCKDSIFCRKNVPSHWCVARGYMLVGGCLTCLPFRLQFLQRAQYVVELKKEHPKFGLNLLSFGRKLVLTVARESSSTARKKEGGATNLKALLAQLERSVLPQLSKRQPFGSCNAFGRPKSCNWEKLGAVRIRHG
eukprot:COSAG02_NODE_10183_length_2000_cov_1.597054_2_plen_218_part_00